MKIMSIGAGPGQKKAGRPKGRTMALDPKTVRVQRADGSIVECHSVSPENIRDDRTHPGYKAPMPFPDQEVEVGTRMAVMSGFYDGCQKEEPRKLIGFVGWGTAVAVRADHNDECQNPSLRDIAFDLKIMGVEAFNNRGIASQSARTVGGKTEEPWAHRTPVATEGHDAGELWLPAVLLDEPAKWGRSGRPEEEVASDDPCHKNDSDEDIAILRRMPATNIAFVGVNCQTSVWDKWEKFCEGATVLSEDEYFRALEPVQKAVREKAKADFVSALTQMGMSAEEAQEYANNAGQ